MFSSISNLLKGRSPQEISREDPAKLKSLKKLQAILHIIRALLVILGITLITLGVTGIVGLPGIIVGTLALTAVLGSLIPLWLHKKSISAPPKPIVESEPLFPWERETMDLGYYYESALNIAEEIVEKVKLNASNDPQVQKALDLSSAKAREIMKKCKVENLEDFYLPLLVRAISQKSELFKLISPKYQDFISICAGYLLVMTSLIHVDHLILLTKEYPLPLYHQDDQLFGDSISENSRLIAMSEKNCGMQLLRAGLKLLYQSYAEINSSPALKEAIQPGCHGYKFILFYVHALENLNYLFNIGEVEKILKLKEHKRNRTQLRNANFLVMLYKSIDQSPFKKLKLIDPITKNGYDSLE